MSSLNNLGFKASFGNLKISDLDDEFFPLIAFYKNGEACLLKLNPESGKISIAGSETKSETEIDHSTFESEFSGYAVIAKKLNLREKEERSGHWFFSAFRKSKWIYVQVMMAAMISNFISHHRDIYYDGL